MQLHQILRVINPNTPIKLFNLNNTVIGCYVNKDEVPRQFLDELVFQISCGTFDENYRTIALHIMLMHY